MGLSRYRLRAVGVGVSELSVRHRVASMTRLTCVLIVAMSGCTIGRFYKGAPLRADPSVLVEGRSTKSEVLLLFGPPVQITHQTDGDAFVYLYRKQNYSSFHLQDPVTGINWFTYTRELEDRDTLVVLFDFRGIVRGIAVDRHVQQMPTL